MSAQGSNEVHSSLLKTEEVSQPLRPARRREAAAAAEEEEGFSMSRGRRRRRGDAAASLSVGVSSVANGNGKEDEPCEIPTHRHPEQIKKRILLFRSVVGLCFISVVFFSIIIGVTISRSLLWRDDPPNQAHYAGRAQPRSNYLRRSNHRRLGQEREHATSYAQRHHSYNSGHHYYSGSGYTFMDEQAEEEVHRRYSSTKTTLTDVWLCLLTTLGWTTWLISAIESRNRAERTLSCIPEDMDERFHQPNGSVLLVRGHVLQVMKTDNDSMGLSIPTYTAVIDYMIESEQTHESIQIRKHFETQKALEQGFSNVELLVLPDEPTHSILKDDFEKQIQQEKQAKMLEQEREKRRHISSFDDTEIEHDDDLLGDVLEGGDCNKKCKRMTMVFAVFLVLASLAGTIKVVCLMDKPERWKGWLSLSFGLVFLVPAALMLHRCLKSARRWNESPDKQGFIVQSSTKESLASPNQQSMKGIMSVDTANLGPASLTDACMPPSCGELVDGLCEPNKKYPYGESASYVVPEMGGCYFVRYPNQKKGHHGVPSVRAVSPQIPEEHLVHKVPLQSADGLVKENSSTSTVSSLSSEERGDNNIRAEYMDPDSST